MLDCKSVSRLLAGWDDILVVCHANPDGDALGSMTGLVRGLRALGKGADWFCPDEVPEKFSYLFEGLDNAGFSPAHIVTVDVADSKLLGGAREKLAGAIQLAIDHHGTHRPFAKERWVDPESAATAEMIWMLLKELDAAITSAAADCVYTGICTDTGCFRFQNTTGRSHRIAGEAMELGARAGEINHRLFETKSLAYFQMERLILDSMEIFGEGRAALVCLPRCAYEATGADENEADAAAGQLREIQGVLVGVTIKEKPDGTIKASLRTNPPANAAAICQRFGGGGHLGAAGCTMEDMDMAKARLQMMEACQEYLKEMGSI